MKKSEYLKYGKRFNLRGGKKYKMILAFIAGRQAQEE